MRSQVETVTVDLNVPAPMRDGTILHGNVYRPAGEGSWPILLTRLPYGKDFPLGSLVLDPVQAARRGYVVIVQDTRGTNTSAGEWYPFLPEANDGVDTIAWAAALPYADGRVGMYGVSYFGYTQWVAAAQQPAALRAIAPMITWADPFNGLSFRGGAFELGVVADWHLIMGLGVIFRRHAGNYPALAQALATWASELDALGNSGYASLPLGEFAPLRRQGVAPAFFDTAGSPMDRSQAQAAATTICGRWDQVQAPSFNIGGWYDIFLAGTIANFQAMRARGIPTKLLIGPWSHLNQSGAQAQRNFGFAAGADLINLQMDLRSMQLRWFDHWLKGLDTGMLNEPPIRIFVMGANVWRDEQEWPLARAVNTPWYLHESGALSPEEPGAETPDTYTYDPANPVPTLGGATLMSPEYPAGPFDQRPLEARPDVLVYRSAPLEHDTEVTGPITVHLWACSSAPDTDFVARLVDIAPDGRSYNLTDGIVRARYRNFAQGEPPSLIEPGQPYPYTIDLWATSNVFRAGHRVGLHLTSSNFPRWDRNPNTGHPFGADADLQVAQQTILHDREHPSHVVLPIVPTA